MSNVHGLTGILLITALDGTVTYCSPAAEAQLGLATGPLTGQPLAALLAAQGPEAPIPKPGETATAPRKVKAAGKTSPDSWFECQSFALAGMDGRVYGHLHLLQPAPEGEISTAGGAALLAADAGGPRQALHRLNNIFASIHSSLDLALATEGTSEARSFLHQAQESARVGARFLNGLRLPGHEWAGLTGEESDAPRRKLAGGGETPTAPAKSLEGSERILVAEDESSMRMLIRAVLTYRGYKVIEAVDGEDAVSKYRDYGPFDLVILDREMPKLGGTEALQRIRDRDPAACALALSGEPVASEGLARDPAKGGFNGCMNKPFSNLILLKLVRQLLDLRRAA
jgi:CheY-like chemotaxis protein